jgi:hypothetical protein
MMDAMVSAICRSNKSAYVLIMLKINGYLPSRIRGNSLLCACNLHRKWERIVTKTQQTVSFVRLVR